MKTKHSLKLRSVISLLIACIMILGMVPTTFAAQDNEYVDPADSWLTANGRTNELDMNATTTYETQHCYECGKDTTVLTYRVPEYTRSGETAANRGVKYSDGANADGDEYYNLDDGTPGVDAKYTGYHWTKSVCNACGTLNPSDWNAHCYNRNVYGLNPCDHNFFVDFDNTEYAQYNSTQHYVYLKEGEYCAFCKGTYAQAVLVREAHDFTQLVDAQLANNRFYVAETCADCGYETSEYVVAKSVITSYYGEVDGEAHTVEVADLSENDVTTRIRYGTEAGNCNRTSAPNFTTAGYHTVYYEIDYIYGGETMTENGVGYVWLLEEDKNNGTIVVIPPQSHEHDYNYLETVKPSCDELGYDRFQCNGCGDLIKTNYVQSLGHNYRDVLIREATCKQNGVKLHMCNKCGDFYEESTPLAGHDYDKHTHDATCKNVGYDEYTCTVCGDNYINNIKPMVEHRYRKLVRHPDCEEEGYTNNICEMCNASYVSDYVDALGHSWDEGRTVTASGCDSEGVIEHLCTNAGCKEKLILASDATGHTPGAEATCTEPQICEVCETVLELPKGHSYTDTVVDPTCTESGYTNHECDECDHSYIDSYTDIIPHDYDAVVTEATCTAMGFTTYTCRDCGDEYVSDYTDKLAHDYVETVTPATCTEFGFSTFTCADCDDSYVSNYTDKLPHRYSESVTPPSCTEDGFSVFTCEDCGTEYIGNYQDEVEHDYEVTVVPATCTEMGYSIYKCKACEHTFNGDYTDVIPHDYEVTVVPATCTELGYSINKCKVCGDEHNNNYVDKIAHAYEVTVTEATCTTMGYSTFVCKDCGDTYKADYVDPKGHTPSEWIVDEAATIEHGGSKHIECTVCGETLQTTDLAQLAGKDNTDEDGKAQVGDYSLILLDENDKPIFNSEIVIDVNDNVSILLTNGRLLDFDKPTKLIAFFTETQQPKADLKVDFTDANGNKVTGATDKDGILVVPNSKSNTGDDNGTIGNGDEEKETYVVRITDKFNVTIPNCEVYIGESNNIVIDLPEGTRPTRENPVIVTVEDQNGDAQEGVTIIALGDSDFIEKGKTDVYGKITLPTASDGYTNEEGRVNVNERNVVVSDENGVIPNAYVVYNEDGSINVDLPEGNGISHHNRVTVTVLDSIAKPIEGVTVTVKDANELQYTGTSDSEGKVFVPPLSEDYTDAEGKAVVNGINVLLTDESKPIEGAFITIADNQINVKLPESAVFDYHNRITAALTDAEGNPAKDVTVIFTDGNGNAETVVSDENGKAIVPPVHKDMTDVEGKAVVSGYNVVIADEKAPIANAYLEFVDGKISIVLPEGSVLDLTNRISVTVTDAEDKPVKDMSVTVKDKTERTETNLTNELGIAIVPPTNIDETDVNGYGELNEYSVTVKNETAPIEKAYIEINENGEISVKLPEGILIAHDNRITVTVANKGDKTPVKDVKVTVTETIAEPEKDDTANEEATEGETAEPEIVEPKTLNGVTDRNGVVVFPALSEDITDDKGDSSVTDTKEEEGKDNDGDGKIDEPGEVTETKYIVTVNDTKGIIADAFVTVKDGKITVKLPETHTLTTSNQTTVTVKDTDGKAVANVSVTINDKTTSKSGTTNANGIVTLPVKTSGGGGGGSYSGGGGGGGSSISTVNVKVVDKDGKTVSVSKSTATDKVTLTLPTGKDLVKDNNYYTITVTDRNGKAKADFDVVLKDKNKNEVTAKTDDKGIVVLPAVEHTAYVKGYTDGTFRPEGDMTRSEAAAIFARLVADKKGETISGKASFKDIPANAWYNTYVGYLEKYDVINGYTDGTFKPEEPVTRAEFTAMAVRYFDIFEEVKYEEITSKYADVNGKYWAIKDISYASNKKWLNGYVDGTFKPDINITRAEVVTVVNRVTGRTADQDYINKNLEVLDRFTDLKTNSHWAFYDIIEAANDHMATDLSNSENWID